MWDMKWIYVAIMLLLPEAWSYDTVHKHLAFNLGNQVNLTCSSKPWNETMFVIWTLKLKNKNCKINFNNDGQNNNSCNDGKELRNTSSAQSYLHIPNFSNDDEGDYKCESVFTGGNDNYCFHLVVTVAPRTSAWLVTKDNKQVAVCKAEKGKPAANISWSHPGNSTFSSSEQDGFFTVESHLEIGKGMDTENLSCVITHPYWKEEYIVKLQHKKGYVFWLSILIAVAIVFLVGSSFFALKKLKQLRRCPPPEISLSKSPPIEDVEEVEPYASYVQRVNSIYNSSADLFT
ncbi:cell surface glycoprotein CD200 receptor 1-A isoform X2 [Centropristis striata]|uniref:cell surface glycoprotein CD200 receptor 1-A isoform X2 n=1 Tax=Centropristis striata TaxID=184440 RepID=UPI0027E01142|nr:cell surface glycoprotein CD200 receptor 1-A isoform X2 [Centropristis striata]